MVLFIRYQNCLLYQKLVKENQYLLQEQYVDLNGENPDATDEEYYYYESHSKEE